MAETGMAADQYLDLLRTRAGQLLDQAPPGSYPRSLAAATQLIADRLARDDPAAAELASVCAFLAPEPIPEDLFTGAASDLPGELAARAADPLAWRQTLAHLTRQSLARIDHRGLQMHRLTQAILRDRLPPAQAAATRSAPRRSWPPATPATRRNPGHLAPVGAADAAPAGRRPRRHRQPRPARAGLRCVLVPAGRAAMPAPATTWPAALRQQWRDRLGDDDEHTLATAHYLAWALLAMGRYAEARDLNQDTLDRHRRVLGEDHPDTLNSANNLAIGLHAGRVAGRPRPGPGHPGPPPPGPGRGPPRTLRSASNLAIDLRELGEVQAARDLDQDTLDRRRRVLGEDHPDTLTSASNLAVDLRALGEARAARDLDQDTLDRRRRVLGDDHPDTLTSASNLAIDLRELGEVQAARDLDQDTLDRRRRVLGDDHPDTLNSAGNLAIDLRELGEADDGPRCRDGLYA